MKAGYKKTKTSSTTWSRSLRNRFAKSRYALAFVMVIAASAALVVGPRVSAAACPTPATDLGRDAISVTIPATGSYTIWTRMQAPDTAHNSINLQIDQQSCYNVGGGSFTATSWTTSSSNWVNYSDGNTATKITTTLTQGPHTLTYIGTQAGVMVDKVVLTTDPSCTPVGAGSCPTGDSTFPTVNLVQPTNNQPITGQTNFTATAVDNSGSVSSVTFLVDNNPVGSDSTNPYSIVWNSATVGNGQHTVTAQATDPSGNTATSTGVKINVTNASGGGSGKPGDVNSDGIVNLQDIAIIIAHWKQTGVTKSQGDANGDGTVNLQDIAIVIAHWKQ